MNYIFKDVLHLIWETSGWVINMKEKELLFLCNIVFVLYYITFLY